MVRGLHQKGRILSIAQDHTHLAIVGLGPQNEGAPDNDAVNEDIDVPRQDVRSVAAVGTKMLMYINVAEIMLDDLRDMEVLRGVFSVC